MAPYEDTVIKGIPQSATHLLPQSGTYYKRTPLKTAWLVFNDDQWVLSGNTTEFLNKHLAELVRWENPPRVKGKVVDTLIHDEVDSKVTSDGSSASYYELPEGATELQHLISHKNMNAQIGEIFRACFRYGEVSHSAELRDAKKIRFYINAEIERLEKLS